jgi:hypothetical protein
LAVKEQPLKSFCLDCETSKVLLLVVVMLLVLRLVVVEVLRRRVRLDDVLLSAAVLPVYRCAAQIRRWAERP